MLKKAERWLYRFRIPPFFQYLILTMAGVYVLDWLFPAFFLTYKLSFIRDAIFHGEIWRLVTFLLLPPYGNILQAALTLYFYYFVGTALEGRWGPRRFLIYYLIGALCAILSGFITGYTTNLYLNLSLFFAFAIQYPDFQLLLFFMFPIKVKWLAVFDGLLYLYFFINGAWADRIALIFSLVNLFLFFGGDIMNLITSSIRQWKRRQTFKRNS